MIQIIHLRARQMVFISPVNVGQAVVVHVDELVAEDRGHLRYICTFLRAENHLVLEQTIAMM